MFNRLLCVIIILIMGANMGITKDYEMPATLLDFLLTSEKIVLYNDNVENLLDNNQCNIIKNSLANMLNESHEMPALGVALDHEIRQEIKNGIWLEFSYSTTKTHNDMYFEKLLIKVNEEDMGFNIYREYNGLYEGRCYYISLNGNMSALFSAVKEILK